jgi:hypothetical protein
MQRSRYANRSRNGHWGSSNAILHRKPRAYQRAVAVSTDKTAFSREVGGDSAEEEAEELRTARGASLLCPSRAPPRLQLTTPDANPATAPSV